ncbi:hypothetical protein [Lacticaseibacillus zhaodongensis]|uniref:hypothetical protein n=1 Tax=Lacticaseibacillus zhaodongensis TaxID=2668065 RepID=UPI0012D2A87F|nr:hypothetical protein [Lacticaseibacillus zhaodongensis]
MQAKELELKQLVNVAEQDILVWNNKAFAPTIVLAVPAPPELRLNGWTTVLMDVWHRVYCCRYRVATLLNATCAENQDAASVFADRLAKVIRQAYGDVDDGTQVFLAKSDLCFVALNTDLKRVQVAINLRYLAKLKLHSKATHQLKAVLRFNTHRCAVLCSSSLTGEKMQRMLNAAGVTLYTCAHDFGGSKRPLPSYVANDYGVVIPELPASYFD